MLPKFFLQLILKNILDNRINHIHQQNEGKVIRTVIMIH